MKRFNPFKGSTPEEAARASRLGAYLLVSAVTLSSFGDLRSYSRQTGSIGVDSWALIATCPVYLVGGVFFIYFRRDRSLVLDLFFVVTTAALIIMNFSVVFYEIGTTKNFNHQLTRLDAFYFTATTFTTTGFGDITPTSQTARGLVAFGVLINFAWVLVVVTTIVGQIMSPNYQFKGRLRR